MTSNPNDLLERYLQAVGQFLPTSTRQDTLAELRANLLEQMDARAEEFNRPLTESEMADMLRAHGRPEVVAARYLPQRSLIGPALFPVYLFALRKALPLVVAIYTITRGIVVITTETSPFEASRFITQIVQAVLQLIPTLIIFWSVVTIVFAAIELVQSQRSESSKQASTCAWDPRKLPAVRADEATGKQRSLTSRIADLVVHCLWMAYCLAVPSNPFILIGPGLSYLESHGIRFAPVWNTFYILLIILLLVQLAMKLIAIVNQNYDALPYLQLITDILGVGASGLMAFASEYFIAVSSAADLHTLANVNHGMSIAFRIGFVFAVFGFFANSWKSIKRHVPTHRLAF